MSPEEEHERARDNAAHIRTSTCAWCFTSESDLSSSVRRDLLPEASTEEGRAGKEHRWEGENMGETNLTFFFVLEIFVDPRKCTYYFIARRVVGV